MSKKRSGTLHPAENRATPQRSGLTVQQFAEAKKLPLEFLEELELRDAQYGGHPAVEIPYRSEQGTEIATRIRLSIDGPDRFRWASGTKVCLYGLDRLADAEAKGFVTAVEGEIDAMTLWSKNWPAIGLPGAATWDEKWANKFDTFETTFVFIEPDKGGDTMLAWASKSILRDRIRLVRIDGFKDPSDLYLDDPDRFDERWQAALDGATTFQEEEARRRRQTRKEAWHACQHLAKRDDILDEFARMLPTMGFAGDPKNAKLLFLVVVSRLFNRPVSAVVKGLSAVGKNFLVKQVLRFFPSDAAYLLTGMSPHAMAYSKEPLVHRMLVLSEAAALDSGYATYLVRSLLSEGFIHYETVTNTSQGLEVVVIHRDGPTGLIATTTLGKLDAELETRLVSVNIEESREQTAAIFLAQARQDRADEIDLSVWHSHQYWLADGPTEVLIPYAVALAELVSPVAVRLRRDFPTLLSVISANALLHRAGRRQSSDKRFVIANLDDYEVARELYGEQMAEGVDATVSKTLRETVEAVARIQGRHGASVAALAIELDLHPSSVSRRLQVAYDRVYLRNSETRPGYPACIMLGEPLPDKIEVLPTRARLEAHWRSQAKR